MFYEMFYEQKHSLNETFFQISGIIRYDFQFPMHIHENYEFIYVEEGLLQLGINGVTFDLKSGEGAFILSNQPHEYFTPSSCQCWLVIFSADYIPYIKNSSIPKTFFSPVIKPDIPNLYNRLNAAQSNPFRVRAILYELAALYFEGENAPQLVMEDSSLVCKVVEYIGSHYTESISLEKMARELGYNCNYMSGIVNKFFKLSFPQVVSRYRIKLACELLSGTNQGATEIASVCGFGSIRSFNRNFKMLMGLSPSEYKNKKR